MLGLFKKKDAGPPRAHLVVEIDPATGGVALDLVSPFTHDEAEAVLEAAFGQARDLTEDVRKERVDTIIRDAQRELGVLDKLRRRGSRWEAEARNVVPTELFTGEAGRGLVEVTIDGDLGFVTVTVAEETGPEAAPGLALEALRHAEDKARQRWFACLKGALEELPDEDKVELGLPAKGETTGAELDAERPLLPPAPANADEEQGAEDDDEPELPRGSHRAFPDAVDEEDEEDGADDDEATDTASVSAADAEEGSTPEAAPPSDTGEPSGR